MSSSSPDAGETRPAPNEKDCFSFEFRGQPYKIILQESGSHAKLNNEIVIIAPGGLTMTLGDIKIFSRLARGYTQTQIAAALGVSLNTIEKRVSRCIDTNADSSRPRTINLAQQVSQHGYDDPLFVLGLERIGNNLNNPHKLVHEYSLTNKEGKKTNYQIVCPPPKFNSANHPAKITTDTGFELTERQIKIIAGIAHGQNQAQIAQALGIRKTAIEADISKMLKKYNQDTRHPPAKNILPVVVEAERHEFTNPAFLLGLEIILEDMRHQNYFKT